MVLEGSQTVGGLIIIGRIKRNPLKKAIGNPQLRRATVYYFYCCLAAYPTRRLSLIVWYNQSCLIYTRMNNSAFINPITRILRSVSTHTFWRSIDILLVNFSHEI